MDVICRFNQSQDPHPNYHAFARYIARYWKLQQSFLLVRRVYSGWERHELTFWVYAGEIFDQYGDNRSGAIVEIALTQSRFLEALEKNGRADIRIDNDPFLKEKLYMACAPASDISNDLSGIRIQDDRQDAIGFLLVPKNCADSLYTVEADIVKHAVKVAFERSSSTSAESKQLQNSLSAIAEQLFKMLSEAATSDKSTNSEPATDDVLQEFLDYTRTTMKAQKCALFLVSDQGNSLTLERISEQIDSAHRLHYDQIPHIPSYDLTHYNPSKYGQGVTPWVLHRKKSFNARSYEELLNSSEGHHKGNWDAFIYGGTENAKNDFKCLYMTPLLAGEKPIGVLKCENRTPDARYSYFDQIDERQINVMAGVLANLVVSQRIERRRYDQALPAISEILLRDFGQPKLFRSLLIECCRLLHANLCSLFVVTDRTDLSLRAIVGLPEAKESQLHYFRYPNYRTSDGLTCLVLQRRQSFNIRSYQDLADRAERKGPGKWDNIVYDSNAAVEFKSLYSIPLRIGEEDIGVLKVENKNVPPFYFTESDERLFDLIGRLIAIGVKYDNEAYLGLMIRAAEMGFLASGIAHEFNNYLQRFQAIASRIGQRANDPGVRILVQDLSKQVKFATHAIENFRMIRDRKHVVETFLVDPLVEQIIAIVQERFKNNNIQLSFQKSGMEVTMNPSELQTILINLLRNAQDAIMEVKRPGHVYLRLTPVRRDSIVIEVADNGKGIDPETKDYLCAPYFSTKGPGGGMGMGLFWINRIVERNSGSLDFNVKNKWGGATFRVILPIKPTKQSQ